MHNNTYIDDVIVSRRLMNNMVNLMSHQERNMRQLITQRNNVNRENPYSYFLYNETANTAASNTAASNTAGLNTAASNTAGFNNTTYTTQPINRPQPTRPNVNRRQSSTNGPRVTTPSNGNSHLQFNNLFTPTRGITRNRRVNIPTALEIKKASETGSKPGKCYGRVCRKRLI